MTYYVDLNSDLGESFGAYQMGRDSELIPLITSANVACGYHAGDPLVMENTTQLIKEAGIALGAHPGFPDLIGFGRRNLQVSPKEAAAYVTYQLGALEAFTRHHGLRLQHVKPHGALYNMAVQYQDLATAIVEAVARYDQELILLCPGASELALAGQSAGLKIAREVFADRAYEKDGSLVARHKEGAMITDEQLALDRLIQMITKGSVQAIDGTTIPIQADSVCVHGDSPQALALVQSIRRRFQAEAIQLRPLNQLI